MKRILDINQNHIITANKCSLCKLFTKVAKVEIVDFNEFGYSCGNSFVCYPCIVANTAAQDRKFITKIWNIHEKRNKIELGYYYLKKLEEQRPNRKILRVIRLLMDIQGYDVDSCLLKALELFYKNNKLNYTYFRLVRKILKAFKSRRIKANVIKLSATRGFHTSQTSKNNLGAGCCGFP